MTGHDRNWWQAALTETMPSLDEHTPKAVYVLWRWTDWQAFSGTTSELFRKAAENLIKPHPSGQLHQNLWISTPAPEGTTTTNVQSTDNE